MMTFAPGESMNGTEVRKFVVSPKIYYFTLVEAVFNLLSFLMMPYLLYRMRTTKMMHPNLRLMLISFTVSLALFNATSLWKNVMYFLLAHLNFLGYIGGIYNTQCWVARIFYDMSENAVSFALIGMSVERIVATFAMTIYESFRSRYLSAALIGIQWFCSILQSIFFTVLDMHKPQYWIDNHILLTCSMIFTRPVHNLLVFIVGFFAFTAFAVVLTWLYRYNWRQYKKHGQQKLAVRYQINENIVTLRFLIPMVILHGAAYVCSLTLVAYVAKEVHERQATLESVKRLWIYAMLYDMPGGVYGVIYCLVCFTLHLPLRQAFLGDVAKLFGKRREGAATSQQILGVQGQNLKYEAEGEVYFRQLQKAANDHYERCTNSARGRMQ